MINLAINLGFTFGVSTFGAAVPAAIVACTAAQVNNNQKQINIPFFYQFYNYYAQAIFSQF